MIHSMTGFGRGQASSDGISVTAELKSVNSRYLDISFRIPSEIQQKELALKELVQTRINRGNLNIQIRINQRDTGKPEVTINRKLAKGYKKLLEELAEAAGIDTAVSLKDLLRFDEVFTSREQDPKAIRIMWELSQKATDDALEKLTEMRAQEGQQLKQDLAVRLDTIETQMSAVQKLTDDRAGEARQKLLERIGKLIDDDKIDHDRLEMEVAILVDKMDITEEIVRLQSHIKFFREALENDDSVGRRLNFLSQEMNREINTIGSKANNSEISQHVVAAKESLEQIREQVQNVE